MKSNQRIYLLVFFNIFLILTSCQQEHEFSHGKSIKNYKSTAFVTTLESEINLKENSIYSVTLLLAWNEIRNIIGENLKIEDKFAALNTLSKSKSFINTLKQGEYFTKVEIEEFMIKAHSEISISLPFEISLRTFSDKLIFNNKTVESFGLNGADEDKNLRCNVIISYYKDDDNFIIKLLPKYKEQEIILFKTESKFKTLSSMYADAKRLIQIGNEERKNEVNFLKYTFQEEDEIVIPKIDFNIETNFPDIEGIPFHVGESIYEIEKVWQRTSFHLDENGAQINSEADLELVVEESEEQEPKLMHFDKPFVIFIRRKEAKNPYFALWVANAELLHN